VPSYAGDGAAALRALADDYGAPDDGLTHQLASKAWVRDQLFEGGGAGSKFTKSFILGTLSDMGRITWSC
jgi:hypothetical protein